MSSLRISWRGYKWHSTFRGLFANIFLNWKWKCPFGYSTCRNYSTDKSHIHSDEEGGEVERLEAWGLGRHCWLCNDPRSWEWSPARERGLPFGPTNAWDGILPATRSLDGQSSLEPPGRSTVLPTPAFGRVRLWVENQLSHLHLDLYLQKTCAHKSDCFKPLHCGNLLQ